MEKELKKVGNIVIENAKIMFRNFAGEESKFNRRGNRNFCVIIDDPENAEQLINDGWNIKTFPKGFLSDIPVHAKYLGLLPAQHLLLQQAVCYALLQ